MWIVVGINAALVVIAAVVGGVLGARANAYPNYYKIDYTLSDACKIFQALRTKRDLAADQYYSCGKYIFR